MKLLDWRSDYIVYWNIDSAGNEIKFGFVGNNQYSSPIRMTTTDTRSTTFPYHSLFAGIDQTMTLNEPFDKIMKFCFIMEKLMMMRLSILIITFQTNGTSRQPLIAMVMG